MAISMTIIMHYVWDALGYAAIVLFCPRTAHPALITHTNCITTPPSPTPA